MRVILIVDPLPIDDFRDETEWLTDPENFSVDLSVFKFQGLRALLKSTRYLIDAVDMNIVFAAIYALKGFGEETVGFASTYEVTKCSDYAWNIFDQGYQVTSNHV